MTKKEWYSKATRNARLKGRWKYLMERCHFECRNYGIGVYIELVYAWADEFSETQGSKELIQKENDDWYDYNGFGFNTYVRTG